MNQERIFELAEQAQLISVINGQRGAFYVPPASILKFAELLLKEKQENANA